MNNTLFTHGVSKEGNRFTVAAILVKDKGLILPFFGYSICSKNDNFNKKLGRTIAEGRATKAFANINNTVPEKVFTDNKEGFEQLRNEMFKLCTEISNDLNKFKNLR